MFRFWKRFRPKISKRSALRAWFALALAQVTLLTAACGPSQIPADPLGKQSLIDQANLYLTTGDCKNAIATLSPLFNSTYTDNSTRLIMASAYACAAGINFLGFFTDVMNNGAALGAPGGLWNFLALNFVSSLTIPAVQTSPPADTVVESAWLASDALMSIIPTNIAVLPTSLFNALTANPGSLNPTDRTNDANLYLTFTSMAGLGGIENRFGLPTAAGKKTVPLPWTTAIEIDSNGCGYAADVINMVNAIGVIGSTVPSNIATSLNTIHTQLSQIINDACNAGCQNLNNINAAILDPALFAVSGVWVQSGCNPAVACATCPFNLANRQACTGVISDQVSCAAAGIINFVNTSIAGWN